MVFQLVLLCCAKGRKYLFLYTNLKGKKIMRKLMAVLSVLTFAMGLTACNTMKGAGKDIERGGEKVQDAAGSTQKKM
jgi:predicted small secreted protein